MVKGLERFAAAERDGHALIQALCSQQQRLKSVLALETLGAPLPGRFGGTPHIQQRLSTRLVVALTTDLEKRLEALRLNLEELEVIARDLTDFEEAAYWTRREYWRKRRLLEAVVAVDDEPSLRNLSENWKSTFS